MVMLCVRKNLIVSLLVKQAMTTVLDIGVPLEVSVGVGDTWLEAH